MTRAQLPPVTLPPPRGPKGKARAAYSGGTERTELEQGWASPAAGVVGALGGVADGAEGPLGAADGRSAGVPAGRLGPVRGRGSKEGVLGGGAGTRAGRSCGMEALRGHRVMRNSRCGVSAGLKVEKGWGVMLGFLQDR